MFDKHDDNEGKLGARRKGQGSRSWWGDDDDYNKISNQDKDNDDEDFASVATYTEQNRRNVLLKPTVNSYLQLRKAIEPFETRAAEGIFLGAWAVRGSLFTAHNIPFDQEEAFACFQDVEADTRLQKREC